MNSSVIAINNTCILLLATFKKEDLVASLFQQLCAQYVQLAHLVAMANNLRKVYFVGTFVNNALSKKYFTYNIVMRGRKDMGVISVLEFSSF